MAERHLGKYEIIEEIGKGGFATVYRARDLDLGRAVALKVLDPVLTRDPVWVARFRREARAVANLDHPRIVTVHEIGQAEGVLYIAMKLVDGGSLAERIRQHGFQPWDEVVRLVGQIAEGLDFAHAQGVLHRDLKPANVLLDRRTGAVLTDFGFARLVADNSLSVSMSGASGGIVGTPAYIAPEIWEGETPAAQTDVYALGCILYEVVTGQVLFTGHSAPAVMRAHFQPRKLPESWPEGVPQGLRDVLETALAVDPAARYGQAGELAAAVAALTLDRLAEPYAALQGAVAVAEWEGAIALAGQIRAQNPDYRDVATLEQQALNGLAEAARQREAAGWREEAEAALAEGDLGGAERAVRQWQRLAPDDPAATAFLVQVEGKRQAVESVLRQAEVESVPPTAEVDDAKLALQDVQGVEPAPKSPPVLIPVVPIAEPEIERQGSHLQEHPINQDTVPALPPAQRERKRRQNIYLAIGAGVAALVVLIGIIVFNNQSQQQISKPAQASSDLPAGFIARNVKGSPDAKVVVTEYSDFECPYCKTFAQTTAKQLEDEYVKTGKVRFEYKHFPLPQHNPSATFAAYAAECAADQGKFWEMHKYLYQEAGKQGTNTFTQTRLKAMAETLGLNTGDFNKCLSNQDHAKEVQANLREGQQLAVSGTPTIYVNGKKVDNPSYPDIKAAIDAALLQQG